METVGEIKSEQPDDETNEVEIKNHILQIKLETNDIKTENAKDFNEDLCEIKTERAEDSNAFELRSNRKRHHQCEHCQKRFFSKQLLLDHTRYEHSTKEIECDICGKTVSNLGNLTRHKLSHLKLPPQICELCGKTFKNPQTLQRHKLWQHKNANKKTTFECERCDKTFAYKSQMLLHIEQHKNQRSITCKACDEKFLSKSNLHEHQLAHCSRSTKKDALFRCEHCKIKFASDQDYTRHMSDRHNFKCHLCDKIFNYSSHLREHKKAIHANITYKTMDGQLDSHLVTDELFICDVCGKSYTKKDSLAKHYRNHTGKRQLKCDLCPKVFTSRLMLQKHTDKYHEVPPKTIEYVDVNEEIVSD